MPVQRSDAPIAEVTVQSCWGVYPLRTVCTISQQRIGAGCTPSSHPSLCLACALGACTMSQWPAWDTPRAVPVWEEKNHRLMRAAKSCREDLMVSLPLYF